MTKHTITALCKSRAATEDALRQLEALGFTEDQISLLMSDATRGKAFRLVEGTKADEGAAAGATFGGVLGAIIGSIGTAGALVGMGVPEHEAKVYEKELSAGNILIAVDAETDERAKQVENVLRSVDATDIAA